MTEWRDARLQRALDAAPDADARPADATRAAVREAARRAVEAAPWWKRSWRPAPRQRMPWNAAFATVLVAVLIGVLWQGEEVPDAVPSSSRVDPPVPAAQAPEAPKPLPAPAPAAPSARSRSAEPPAPPAAPAPAAPQERRTAGAQRAAKDSVAAVSPAPPLAESAPSGAAAAKATAPAAPAPPPLADVPAPPQSLARAPAADAAADTAAPRAAAAPMVKSMPRREFAAQAPAPDWRAWTQVRIESEGRAVVLARPRAQALAPLVEQAAAIAQSSEPLALLPVTRIELSHQGVLLGVLEIAGDQLRWSAPQLPGPSRTARPDPAQLQALRDEARRALAK